MTMYKTVISSGLIFCVTLLFFTYRPVTNFFALLMVPVGDQGINIVSLELAILKNPNDATAYYNRGTLYSQGIDDQAAIKDFTKVILLDSKESSQAFSAADGYCERGDVYRRLGDNEKAIADYQRAAGLYHKQGKYSEYEYMAKLIESSY